ncbi:MAG TPA: hypothetical protein VI039_05825 [Solirubrobacterales bacterium]
MTFAKVSALLGLAVSALLAFSATASATQVTAPAGTLYTGNLSLASQGTHIFHAVVEVKCNKSSLVAGVSTHGSDVTANGAVSTLTFTECDQHVVVLSKGSLETHATSGGNGQVTSTGLTITIEFTTIFGNVHCAYGTNNTPIGTLTAAAGATGHAVLDVSAVLPAHIGSFLCGSSMEWTGTYKVTSPTGLRID